MARPVVVRSTTALKALYLGCGGKQHMSIIMGEWYAHILQTNLKLQIVKLEPQTRANFHKGGNTHQEGEISRENVKRDVISIGLTAVFLGKPERRFDYTDCLMGLVVVTELVIFTGW